MNTETTVTLFLELAHLYLTQGKYDRAYQELRAALGACNRYKSNINKGRKRYILSAMSAIRRRIAKDELDHFRSVFAD